MFLIISKGLRPCKLLIKVLMYVGVVPQQPPNIVLLFAIILISWLYSSGTYHNNMIIMIFGKPALA